MLADAAAHPAVVTIEDGYREGGIGVGHRRPPRRRTAARRPRLRVLGVPVQFIPHGKPDAILAGFGLDAAGVAAAAGRLVTRA